MKISRRQIEETFVRQVEASAQSIIGLLEHRNSKSNPHKVSAAQTGTYSAAEIDAKDEAIVNQSYAKAYWYGRKFSATPWPLPESGETWPEDDRDGFDFETHTPWYWDGTQWVKKSPIELANGMTIGASKYFLDIVDFGFPGLARYSEATESWDFYPNKYNEMDPAIFTRDKAGKETVKEYSIQPNHLANPILLLEGDITTKQLPAGVYKGQELKILNDADSVVELFSGTKTISIQLGEILELRWNGTEWRVKTNKLVGDFIKQLPSERSPLDKCLEGEWVNWSGRAVIYGVSENPPPEFTDYYEYRGLNPAIAANQKPVVCYHVQGSDWQLFQFKSQTSAYTLPDELDPVKWNLLEPELRVIREDCQKLAIRNPDTREITVPDDLAIGDQITEGIHTGKYISEVLVLGGKFISVEGGNRPTFVSGGVARDEIRNIFGKIGPRTYQSSGEGTGAFLTNTEDEYNDDGGYTGLKRSGFSFDSSRVIPTGPEVSPRTLASRKWRRIA